MKVRVRGKNNFIIFRTQVWPRYDRTDLTHMKLSCTKQFHEENLIALDRKRSLSYTENSAIENGQRYLENEMREGREIFFESKFQRFKNLLT